MDNCRRAPGQVVLFLAITAYFAAFAIPFARPSVDWLIGLGVPDEFVAIVLGLIVTLWLGLFVPALIGLVKESMPALEPPDELHREPWGNLIAGHEGGEWIGYLERFAFFGALVAGMPEFVPAWLVFKVGAKWQAWQHVNAVAGKMSTVGEWDWLVARRRWGSQLLATFLVGTLANILVGFIGAQAGCPLLRALQGQPERMAVCFENADARTAQR